MTSTVRWASVLTATALVGLTAGSTGAAQAAPAGTTSAPEIVGVDAVVEVDELGAAVSALVVEYDSRLRVRAADLPTEAFEVSVTVDGLPVERTVVDVYLSHSPEPGEERRVGQYLVVELATAEPGAAALAYNGTVNERLDLDGAYLLEIDEDVVDARGRVQVPATGDAVANDDVVRLVVDDFQVRSTTGTSGSTLRYGLYTPPAERGASEELLPLVVALHGAGERGTDGTVQLMANELAVAFAEPERQATDRSIVLAPQAPPPSIQPVTPGSSVWEVPAVQQTLMELIERTIAEQPVDPDRVYLTGLSMGSMGTFDILPKHPDLFAAALPTTGYADQPAAPVLATIPIWATHSVDDGTVLYDRPDSDIALFRTIASLGTPVVFDEWAANLPDAENEARAQAQWDAAEAAGADHLFTTWTAGTTPVNPHFSWVPTYSNAVMLDWLFSHERD
ncbi:PHB depolymerase family esterase [Aquipuribacter hungaricus]|uniref:PHB depolymerase family esterase n=1 Tax=Aquipuribacter hungaricus TaxID=545624 RepID=A0ABV7WJ35_9MICO